MKSLIKLLVMLFAVSVISAHADDVVATYGKDKKVTDQEITKWLLMNTGGRMPENKKSFSEISEKLKEGLVKQYVIQQELVDIARNSAIQKSEAFQFQLDAAKNALMVRLYLEKYATNNMNKSLVKEQYRKFVKNLRGADDLEVSHILVETEDQANNAYKDLKKGASFGEVAGKYSKDTSTKDKKGKFGKISRGQVLPKYEEAAYKLKKGKYSKPVQTQVGWFIIQVDERIKKKIPTLEEVKPQMEAMAKEAVVKKYLDKISKKTKIKLGS